MSNYTGAFNFHAQVYQFEESDVVKGGPDGIDNVPLTQLSDRTFYLKALADFTFLKLFNLNPLGSFKQGFQINVAGYAVFDEASGKWFKWTGSLPKVVVKSSKPETTGGIYDPTTNPSGKWVAIDFSVLDLGAGVKIPTAAAPGNLYSGKYNPAFVKIENVSNLDIAEAIYTRLGNVVTVNGKITASATDAGEVMKIGIGLPINATFSDDSSLSGVGVGIVAGQIYADVDSSVAVLEINQGSTDELSLRYTFSYTI
ncbi:hypothetical protein [Escherichia phage vB_EcoM_IME392]|jgi:hypothetical protein|nr:hypothetical protein [Escherichia phage vB_EcoM_IME392]